MIQAKEEVTMSGSFLNLDGIVKIEIAKEFLVYQCNFDINSYYPELFQELSINFPQSLSKAVKKRQAEYLAGRYIAHYTLKQLGIDVFDIPSGKGRSPCWPNKISGSITHTNKKALSAAGHSNHCELLGLDLEVWIKPHTVSEIKQLIINDKEQLVLSTLGWTNEQSLTLAFSAKESLFKALYPKVQKYFNFNDARITSISLENHTFTIELEKDLSFDFPRSTEFKGQFLANEAEILTVLYRKA